MCEAHAQFILSQEDFVRLIQKTARPSAGQHMLHSGVELMGLTSRAYDVSKLHSGYWSIWGTYFPSGDIYWFQVWIHLGLLFLKCTNGDLNNEVEYSPKMNLLSNFGFLLLLNYVPVAAYVTISKEWIS